jgi:hypothetical protein
MQEDVYNMDETGLFFRMLPDRSLVHVSEEKKGVKKAKERVTVALCANASGSHKLKPLVIGHSKKPRSFQNFNQNLYVDYDFNKKAWMMGALFQQWMQTLDRQMKRDNRKILLLLDNAPGHLPPANLSNIQVHFLPPCTTSRLQPMDSGIIYSFKSQYRKLQVTEIVSQLDNGSSQPEITLRDAIRFISMAWNSVTSTVISNCWNHTGIYKATTSIINEVAISSSNAQTGIRDNIFHRLSDFIGSTSPNLPRLSFEEYVQVDAMVEIEEAASAEENEVQDGDQQIVFDEEPPAPPTTTECARHIQQVRLYFEANCSDASALSAIEMVNAAFREIRLQKQRQMTILDYFKRS